MPQWTIDRLPDLSDKLVIVTGGNCGLGLASARACASKGAQVVLACRSPSSGAEAREAICAELPSARVHVMRLDLADLISVTAFASEVRRRFDCVDVLMNNAGVMNVSAQLTRQGFEYHLGVNHLGHFALTGLLLPALLRSRDSRVVTVSSSAHWLGEIDFDDMHFSKRRPYTPLGAYAQSKLANLLFAFELQRLLQHHHLECASVAAHPGAAQTNLGRHIERSRWMRLARPLLSRLVQDADRGAWPQLRAATDSRIQGGQYVGPDGLLGMRGHPVHTSAGAAARSPTTATRLWRASERLTGVSYAFALDAKPYTQEMR